jgi:3',5'-cyclic AMP phosphodiesterase CpdA
MLIAQITDSHLVPKGTHWKNEPETEIASRLSRAIDCLNSLNPRPDVAIFTGDAVDEGDLESYQYFRELTESLKIPFFVVPGNHDDREVMRKSFSDLLYMPKQGFLHYSIEDFPVRLIGLDTVVEGKDYGQLCEERLSWLEETLENRHKKPTLIFMHHPPIKVGAKAFDTKYTCYFTSGFEDLIRKDDSILGIVAGHYHHLCASAFGGKSCFIAPSLAPTHYFAHPDDDEPTALELDDPAVTLHKWLGGNAMSTHVVRLKPNLHRIGWKNLSSKQSFIV